MFNFDHCKEDHDYSIKYTSLKLDKIEPNLGLIKYEDGN